MKDKKQLTRRHFIKSTGLASTAIIGGSTLHACSTTSGPEKPQQFPLFNEAHFNNQDGVSGLLFSQIGYEMGHPVRVLIRMPEKNALPDDVYCLLKSTYNEQQYQSPCTYWGTIWKSHWWVAEFAPITEEGTWNIEVKNDKATFMKDVGLKVKDNILWDETIEWSSVDMLERRVHFTKVGAGWQDAGTLWVESPAQSAMTIALTELLNESADRFDKTFTERIHKQITVGCDYFVMLQDKAKELGFPEGAMSHDLHGHEKDVLPHDVSKSIVALAKAVQLLPDEFSEKKQVYWETAKKAADWLFNVARPMGDYGLSRFQRGLPEDAKIPTDEWQTRNLVTMCWAALEMWKAGDKASKDICIAYAQKIMDRQIPEQQKEMGYYGHFKEYDSLDHSEKAWAHGIVNGEFGSDIGAVYPNFLLPFVEMLKLWPDHEAAGNWKSTLKHFAFGYLIPVCEKNPFHIIPLGIFKGEGPIWFCGTFHGTNTIYGYTAALALEMADLFDEPKLIKIAYGNLQWLAGLNAGITKDNLEQGCVVFSADLPENRALPASMVCHIGSRWAGTWFQTRGVICNGFTTGKQFVYDVAPKRENDGPFSLTDEDWIPHSAGWLTGLTRLYNANIKGG